MRAFHFILWIIRQRSALYASETDVIKRISQVLIHSKLHRKPTWMQIANAASITEEYQRLIC